MLDRRHAKSEDFDVPFFGLQYLGHLDDWIDKHIFYFGAYSREELHFLEFAAKALRRKHRDVNFFDVGANVGQHSLFMHDQATRIFAFEPSETARIQFENNIQRNRIGNITVYPIALGDRDGEGALGSGLIGNRGSRSLLWTREGSLGELTVVRNGDTFLDQEHAPPIDLLKLDVEGFEKRVLSGLAQRLVRDRPVILMELMGESNNKGGFQNEAELRTAFYPQATILSLEGRKTPRLMPFDWDKGEIVVIPDELANEFLPLMTVSNKA